MHHTLPSGDLKVPDWSALTLVQLGGLSCYYWCGVLKLIAGGGACAVQCVVRCHIGAVGGSGVILSILILPKCCV